jgi:hypothetical protein
MGGFCGIGLFISGEELGYWDLMGGRLSLVVQRQLVSKTPRENAKGQSQEREAPEETEPSILPKSTQNFQTQ